MKTTSLIKGLRKHHWYNQRFDGSPLFLYFMGSADVKIDSRKPKGTNGKIGICIFSHGKADWFFAMADIQSASTRLISLAKKQPDLSKHLLKAWRTDEQKFECFFWHQFQKFNLKRMSNQQLFTLLKKIFKLFTQATSSTAIIDRFALGTDELLSNMLRKEIFSKRLGYKESKFTELFSSLTAPVHQSFINQAEIDLLKIAANKSSETIEHYQSRYFWLNNNYINAQVLPVSYFKKQILSWRRARLNLNENIRQRNLASAKNKKLKTHLLKKFKLSRLLKTLLQISEDFIWWQDQRKKFTYFNIHMGHQVLREISKRTGYTTQELKYTLLPEIKSILLFGRPKKAALKERIKKSVMLLTPSSAHIFAGLKAKKIISIIKTGRTKTDLITDFRGLSASTGRAIGPARIIKSATEIKKIQPGDILVACMTRPDYVPAMKKAAAIVTDEGGITSHAAITSRELGIPCIIGTKIATKVIHNGDIIEVNANHGWVKRLKT